ncbi:hypothetical protein LCGC14_0297790 [marine sediment metagenome]|uniref:Uncharacterized protein n=1 Tax=marine sediment metagenome TaxID=412755 RepID=A0A0F9TR49_9ZZZZ
MSANPATSGMSVRQHYKAMAMNAWVGFCTDMAMSHSGSMSEVPYDDIVGKSSALADAMLKEDQEFAAICVTAKILRKNQEKNNGD